MVGNHWGCKTCKFQDSLFRKKDGKIKLLDGKYTWYDKKGHLFSEHVFKNGQPIWWKEYHSNGKLYLFFDYTKKCEGEPLSWWLYQYDKQGNLKATIPTSKGCGGMWIGVR
jgi:antitoxin component YwqK of YwqJK toxin-antitoxin module